MVRRFGWTVGFLVLGCAGNGGPPCSPALCLAEDAGGLADAAAPLADAAPDAVVADSSAVDMALPKDTAPDSSVDSPPIDARPPDTMPDSTPDTTPDTAPDTTPDTAPDTAPVILKFTAIMIVDQYTDEISCSATTGPGADIDAVDLLSSAGARIGVGKVGTAMYAAGTGTSSPCADAMCSGGVCKYAKPTLVSRTEGSRDAVVNAVGDDVGYFSLNNGRVQLQFGDLSGAGPATAITSGMQVKVWEVDQLMIEDARAPASCKCVPEKFDVYALTAPGSNVGAVKLKRQGLNAKNSAHINCQALPPGDQTTGCGTTVFAVP